MERGREESGGRREGRRACFPFLCCVARLAGWLPVWGCCCCCCCCAAPDSVVAVDAPVEREEEEAAEEEPSAAVGHMLSIPMMSYSFDASPVSLAAFLALVSWRVCLLLYCVLLPCRQPLRPLW